MNQRTCLSCDNYRGEKETNAVTLINCRHFNRWVESRPIRTCIHSQSRTPGSDEEEFWDELPDGEGFV